MNREQLAAAISFHPLEDLWQAAISCYQKSGSFRGSEANFAALISPFAGRLSQQQHDQLIEAVICNGQNWDAAETHKLLFRVLNDATPATLPSPVTRERFYKKMLSEFYTDKFSDILTLLQSDGWSLPTKEN